jgi:hypothetical protein
MPPNTSCDIYRNGRAPPLAPDVAGVRCYLAPKGQSTLTSRQGSGSSTGYSHIMHVPVSTDVRDGSGPASIGPTAANDSVYVPNQNGQQFIVVLVRRRGYGSAVDHLEVLLNRAAVTWPQSNL